MAKNPAWIVLAGLAMSAVEKGRKVATAMTQRLETLAPSASFAELLAVLNHDHVAIIVHDGRFFGLITRYDLLTHLRRSLP